MNSSEKAGGPDVRLLQEGERAHTNKGTRKHFLGQKLRFLEYGRFAVLVLSFVAEFRNKTRMRFVHRRRFQPSFI